MSTLAISSYYYPQGDFVEVTLQGIDDSGEPIGPQNLEYASISLLKNNVVLQSSDNMDKFYMDVDWQIHVLFSRPLSTQGLEIEAVFVPVGSPEIRKRVNVLLGEVTAIEADFGDNAVNRIDE